MNDPKILRADGAKAKERLAARHPKHVAILEQLLFVDRQYRQHLKDVEEMRSRRNVASKAIGKAIGQKNTAEAEKLKKEVLDLKAMMTNREEELAGLKSDLQRLQLSLPNIPHDSVPVGTSEADNKPVRDSGTPPKKDFAVKDHATIGEALGILDFDTAAKLSGSRFAVVAGDGARLQRAVGQFMLDLHTREHGYRETYVPFIVRPEALEGTGQLPKFEQDLYKTGQFEETEKGAGDAKAYYLIPTAEVPLTNLVREEIVAGDTLPRRYTALTPCFRQEAGSYGKDTRGLIRQHQFEKTELVWICKPAESMAILEKLTAHAEEVLKRLELPYRVIELCTADIGFGACKTYDLEVWMAGEGKYREISSCSNCGDFQARRMNARYREAAEAAPQFVHTLNGSGLAIGRAFAAILENCQNADGSVSVPDVLRPYTGFDKIAPQ